jgi:Flp pilus assembly pilin Flp
MRDRFGEEGQGLAEYGWTVVLIAILLMAVLIALGGATTGLWEKAWHALEGAFTYESEAMLLPLRHVIAVLALML